MHASVGDRIVVKGHHAGQPDRNCEVVGLRHADGSPPYLVRWSDHESESLYFPGADALVQHRRQSTSARGGDRRKGR